jgi:hypothetical protein
MQRKHLLGLSLVAAAAAASVAVVAQRSDDRLDREIAKLEALSPDMPVQAQRNLALKASDFMAAKSDDAKAKGPTVEDVYDVDSFGREVIYLGLTSAFITLEETCPPPDPAVPDQYCQQINPTVGAPTAFTFNDAARIKLPGKATHSLLCYWFSPILNVSYGNATAAPVIGRFRYSPTLTVENPVLDDPALIDATTGVPFGGKLLTSMSSSESYQQPLDPGMFLSERTRDSAVCMAGLLSKRSLTETYGLTEAQAKEFFKKPTTIRLNVSGSAQHVNFVGMTFGLRMMGDER